MDIIQSYKDLCEELEIWKWRVEAYKAQIRAIRKMAKLDGPSDITGIDYSRLSVQNSGQMSFEDALIQISKIESHLILHLDVIERMEKAKKEIERRIKKLEGLDKKVVYMRDIEGKKLREISDELGYSYDYIKEISARNKPTQNLLKNIK